AEKHGIATAVIDPDVMLADDSIQGVLVDSPDAVHHDHVMRALRAGKHIFCEKPLARTVEEAREMYATARTTNRRTVVGFSSRWRAIVNAIKERLDSDEIGEVVHVHAQSFNASLIRSDRPRFSWRTDAVRTGTGILGDLGAHFIDLTHYLLGPITEVCADLQTVVPEVYDEGGQAHPHRVDDDSIFLFKLARDGKTSDSSDVSAPTGAGRSGRQVHGTMGLSRLGSVHADFPIGRRHFLIDGRKGGILFENDDAWLFRPDGAREQIPGGPPMAGSSHGGALLTGAMRQMETFVTAIREDRDISPTFAEGLLCQEVLHACVESSKTRSWQAVRQLTR
ncbi:MAG TPA: Gfo/Idh/MocA family oxidoreductase, partial [Chloroflexota bacterium]|nr:Gfo/Idh/MocA family oxidoreductase [Chloroflexota bacterium]